MSKAETIQEVRRIKVDSVEQAEQLNCKIGHIFVFIGFRLDARNPGGPDLHKDLL